MDVISVLNQVEIPTDGKINISATKAVSILERVWDVWCILYVCFHSESAGLTFGRPGLGY